MIILVDDDINYTYYFSKKLEKNGYKVTIFNSISSYKQMDADLYIVDLHLEDKAYDLIKQVRSETDKPIMVLSGYNITDYVVEALNAGADCYVIKGTDLEELMVKIKTLINIYKRLKNV